MFERVEDYLDKLERELAGSDPAMVQDALADAEDHLRSGLEQLLSAEPGLARDDALARVVEAYGAPAEVADAYRTVEAGVGAGVGVSVGAGAGAGVGTGAGGAHRPERPALSRFLGVFVDPRAYASRFYMFFSMITGVAYFTWAVTGMSLTVGLFVLIIGIPFAMLFLLSVRGIGLVEGRLVEALLGVRMPRRSPSPRAHLGLVARLKRLVTDGRSWTTILYMVLQLPLGVVYFTVFVTMLSLGLSGVATPIIQYGFDLPVAQFNDTSYFLPVWMMPLVVIVGVIWILLTMHLAKLLGRVHGRYAKSLLVRSYP